MAERGAMPGGRRAGSAAPGIAAWAALVALAGWAGAGCGTGAPADHGRIGELSVGEVLGGEPGGFAIADTPRSFVFPADHGPHPGFRSEWWYVTGSVATASGRPFGFQVTFFRTALAPTPVERLSAWATTQLYMAHLAVTDPRGASFRAHESFARGALGLAGAQAVPFRVWLEGWELAAVRPGGGGAFPARLRADAGAEGLELVLEPAKPLVLQGTEGLSRKGRAPANASYYYSYTRLRAAGTLRVDGDEHQVAGTAWLDREWSTSALEPDQAGWDWFALQLEDGYDVMLYLMRRTDGARDRHSSGVVVDPAGVAAHVGAADFSVEVLDHWRSESSGIRYPSRWRVSVPGEDLVLEVEPLLPDQELDLAFRYWEGAVGVTGSRRGRPVAGRGYVEMTGYGRDDGARSLSGSVSASLQNSER